MRCTQNDQRELALPDSSEYQVYSQHMHRCSKFQRGEQGRLDRILCLFLIARTMGFGRTQIFNKLLNGRGKPKRIRVDKRSGIMNLKFQNIGGQKKSMLKKILAHGQFNFINTELRWMVSIVF